jgi:hypothetical protein
MADIHIDGDKLRAALTHARIRQTHIAKSIGVTKFTVSRWCAKGTRLIQQKHAKAIADMLKVSLDDFICYCGATKPGGALLTEAEIDWLTLYRNLDPLSQAKVRVAIESIVQNFETKAQRKRKRR